MIVPDINENDAGLQKCSTCSRLFGVVNYQFRSYRIDCDCNITEVCPRCGGTARAYVLHRLYLWNGTSFNKVLIPFRVPHCLTLPAARPPEAHYTSDLPDHTVRAYVCDACAAGHHEHCYGSLETRTVTYECRCEYRGYMGQWGTLGWSMRLQDRRRTLSQIQSASPWLQ